MNLHNLNILASMALASVAIVTGGWWAMAGITWNMVVLMANITAPAVKDRDKKETPVGHDENLQTKIYNTVIIAQKKEV